MTTVIMICLVLLSAFSIVAGREINRLQGRVWELEWRLSHARVGIAAAGGPDSRALHTHGSEIIFPTPARKTQ